MKLTGIADEAGNHIATQIKAHQQLGWDTIEARFFEVDGFEKGSFHEVPGAAFDQAVAALEQAGMGVCGVGATIANWAHSVKDDFQITLDEIARCIPRMQRVGSKIVRIMSYAILEDGAENDLGDQMKEERFRRLREIKARFDDAGITAVHENCMNFGGMSIPHALELQENVPGLKWVFDTGNPVFNPDRAQPRPYPRQDAWEWYQALKPHIVHVHVKDGTWDAENGEAHFTFPGEGDGYTREIIADLKATGYDGYISIEPHVSVVFHDTGTDERDPEELAREQFDSYVRYGEAMKAIVASA
jgi:sugar phosphate isomerase/epimerase